MAAPERGESCGSCNFHNQTDETGMGECTFLSGQSEGQIMSEGVVKTPNGFYCSGFQRTDEDSGLDDLEDEISQSRHPMESEIESTQRYM